MTTSKETIRTQLAFLYGVEQAEALWAKLQSLLQPIPAAGSALLSEKDALLITYGDSLQRSGQAPLATLADFLSDCVGEEISGVHILPFYPYSSDDGFSVIDYRTVNPALGQWIDIARLRGRWRLMFDAVINHISRKSEWFQAFERGEAPFRDFFITPGEDWDLTKVVRPRTLPLLTTVKTAAGEREVWTTFSDDQMDLNYANPAVLLEIIDLLLFYARQGAEIIRLDAIAYLWKEPGTKCIHLPQTHGVIKILRAALDIAAPHVLLISETNVPHAENISYFGQIDPASGHTDEAQLVYQFPLAPLTLHSFYSGSAEKLSHWAAGLQSPGIFFNFLASHDGIGVTPAQGIMTSNEMNDLVEKALRHGGQVSYKTNPNGMHSAYELNITLYDALNNPAAPDLELDTARFMAAQGIMLSLAGVPGIYVHSLFGSRNWQAGVEESGRARSINREKLDEPALRCRLADEQSREARVFNAYKRLLRVRRQHPAFHPRGGQKVLEVNPAVFALLRESPDRRERVACLVNVRAGRQLVRLPLSGEWRDLLSNTICRTQNGSLAVELGPYQLLWLAARPE